MLRDERYLEQGFQAFCRMYQERIYYQIRRMVLDHDDADDVYQNTMIKIFKGISSFEGKSSIFTWVYRIATNETLTFLQKKNRYPHQSLSSGSDSEQLGNPGRIYDQLAADPYFDGDQLQLKFQEAIALLPEKQKLVFHMRYYDELSYKDMSAILDTSEGALKASFHHAVKKIEEYLKDQIDE